MDKLKDELKTEFDPIKTALKDQIKDKISEDNYFIQFQDLEEDKDFLQEVKYLLSNPALIGEESIEKHPSPVFVDNEQLEAATHYIARIPISSYTTETSRSRIGYLCSEFIPPLGWRKLLLTTWIFQYPECSIL